MKIVLVTSNFPYGGASSNFLRYLTLSLSDKESPIEVFIPTGSIYGIRVDSNKERQGKIENIKFKHLGFLVHPNNYIGKILDNILGITLPFFFLLHKTIINDLDTIIIYSPTFISMANYLIIKLILRKKLIVIIPEFYEKPSKISLTKIKWYNFYLGIRYLVKYADKFIVLSSYLENYLVKKLKSSKEILLLPNLTDPKRFEIYAKPYITNKITIGYIGTPTYKDGVLDLIKSYSLLNKKYPKTHLLIIGDLTNGKTIIPDLNKYAKELNVEDKITFTGLVSHQRVPGLLKSCQILALTRPKGVFAEAGFPTKLGEYFACKIPVVITSVGDIPKYFKHKEHVILVEPNNIDSIVKGFEMLINNTELCQKLSNNAYDWMNNNLNYRNISRKIGLFFRINNV